MEIDDRWFDAISPERETVLVLNGNGNLESKELEVYALLLDRKDKKVWLRAGGVVASQSAKTG